MLLLKYAKINTKKGKRISQQNNVARKASKYELRQEIYFENYRMLPTIQAHALKQLSNQCKEREFIYLFVNAARLLWSVFHE